MVQIKNPGELNDGPRIENFTQQSHPKCYLLLLHLSTTNNIYFRRVENAEKNRNFTNCEKDIYFVKRLDKIIKSLKDQRINGFD